MDFISSILVLVPPHPAPPTAHPQVQDPTQSPLVHICSTTITDTSLLGNAGPSQYHPPSYLLGLFQLPQGWGRNQPSVSPDGGKPISRSFDGPLEAPCLGWEDRGSSLFPSTPFRWADSRQPPSPLSLNYFSLSPLCPSFIYIYIYLIYLPIYILFLAVLGLRFCVRAFSRCGKWGPLFIAVRGPLTVAAPPIAEHGLQTRRLSSCGSPA